MLKIPVDYSDEAHHDNLVRNSSLQLCLSIMNHLGFRGDFHPRSFGSKFAMLALNVRNIVILITIASNAPVGIREKLSPLDEHGESSDGTRASRDGDRFSDRHVEVVDALAGCAKWSLDLVCWLADCLFQLLDDPVFLSFLTSREQFNDMTQYLQSKNDVSLHLLLCSSTRGFISAVCRRLLHLDSISNRAIQYYEQRAAAHASQPNSHSKNPPLALHIAYQKMQNFTSNTLIKVAEFDKLLNALTSDIRESYRHTFSKLPSDEKESNEAAIKRAQTYCELRMLLASSPPPNFLSVVSKFFHTDLRAFRAKTDPGALFFYDCSLLEVDDDRRSLARRRREGHYVDVFKRVELRAPVHGTAGGPGSGATAARPYVIDPNELPGNGGAGGPGAAAAGGVTNGTGAGAFGSVVPPQWRRCARCASVMEDVWGHRPGFSFVLGQQRKCSCGGSWGLLPRGALVS